MCFLLFKKLYGASLIELIMGIKHVLQCFSIVYIEAAGMEILTASITTKPLFSLIFFTNVLDMKIEKVKAYHVNLFYHVYKTNSYSVISS